AQVADGAGDVERAGARADARIAVERDGPGPRIVAGDILECPVAEHARAVQSQWLGNDAHHAAHLQLGVLTHRRAARRVAERVHVRNAQDAGIVVDLDRPAEAAVVGVENEGARTLLGKLRLSAGRGGQRATQRQIRAEVHRYKLERARGPAELNRQVD